MKKLLIRIKCWFSGHDWTCKASQGIEPPAVIKTFEELAEYAKMYCSRCKIESKLNKRLK